MLSEAEIAYEEINNVIVPEILERFKQKQRGYKSGRGFLTLGEKGQFSDIHRKFWKLYGAMWLGEDLEGEDIEEVLADMIGHCFLSLYCVRNREPEETEEKEDEARHLADWRDVHRAACDRQHPEGSACNWNRREA